MFSFKKIPYYIKYILILFVVTRVVLLIIGISSQMMLDEHYEENYVWKYSENKALDIWGVWDTGWYLNIAKDGYSTIIGRTEMTPNQGNIGFFPLYPLLIKIVNFFINDFFVSGIIISNICFLLAAVFLYKLVLVKNNEEVASRSVKYLFLFPTAFIFSAVFSEALFLMLIVMSFYQAEKKNVLAAGIIGFLAALTRPLGVFLLLILFLKYFEIISYKIKKVKSDIIYLFLILLGPALFFLYLYYLTGSYWAYIDIQKIGWGHYFLNPIISIWQGIISRDIFQFLPTLLLISFLALIIVNYKKIKPSYLLLIFLFIFIPLSSGTVSLNSILRYLLPVFPIYIILAKLSLKNSIISEIITISLLLLQGFLMVFWANGFHLIV